MATDLKVTQSKNCDTRNVGVQLARARTLEELEEGFELLRACQMRGDVGPDVTTAMGVDGAQVSIDWARLQKIAETPTPFERLRAVANRWLGIWPIGVSCLVVWTGLGLELSRTVLARAVAEQSWQWWLTAGVISVSFVLLTCMSLYVLLARWQYHQATQTVGEATRLGRRGIIWAGLPCAVAIAVMVTILSKDLLNQLALQARTWHEVTVADGETRLIDPNCGAERNEALRQKLEEAAKSGAPISSIVLRQADPQSLNSMGVYLEAKKEYGTAQAFYAMAQCGAPKDPRVQFNLQNDQLLKALNDGLSANRLLVKQLGKEQRRFLVEADLTELNKVEFDMDQASCIPRQGKERASVSCNAMGIASEMKGDAAMACKWYIKAIEQAPDDPAAKWNLRGVIEASQGKEIP
jgi:tetratricopeptide (TPR) repeat protein